MDKENDFMKYLKKSKYSIIIIIGVILFAFGERIISQSFSIDTELYIGEIGAAGRWNWWITLNRWGLVLLNKIFQMGSLPIFASNFLTVILIIAYSIGFNYLFYTYTKEEYKEKFLKYQFIFPILFVTNPIFAEQYNFILQNISVAFTVFLIPIILLIIDKASKVENKIQKILYYVISIALLILSFGVYQSVILLYIVTVGVCYLLKVLKDNDNNWKYLGKQIGIFLAAALVYFVIGKVLAKGSSTSYLQMAWLKDSVEQCLKNIYVCVKAVIKCEGIFYNIGYVISILISAIFIIYLCKKKKLKIGVIISIIGLLSAPFYIMIITGVDQLKRTQFNYPFVAAIVIMYTVIYLSKIDKLRWLKNAFIVLVCILAYTQSYNTANLFNTVDVQYRSDEAFAYDLMSKIESKDWYNPKEDYKIIFVGRHQKQLKNVYLKSEVIGSSFFAFDYEYIYGVNSRGITFLNILGYKLEQPTAAEFEEAKKYVEENNIKEWPNEEAIKLVDNKIIVRLSEEY